MDGGWWRLKTTLDRVAEWCDFFCGVVIWLRLRVNSFFKPCTIDAVHPLCPSQTSWQLLTIQMNQCKQEWVFILWIDPLNQLIFIMQTCLQIRELKSRLSLVGWITSTKLPGLITNQIRILAALWFEVICSIRAYLELLLVTRLHPIWSSQIEAVFFLPCQMKAI